MFVVHRYFFVAIREEILVRRNTEFTMRPQRGK